MADSVFFLRNVVGNYMTTLGERHANVAVVNADLMGTCRNGGFVSAFPERAFNVGIAEQNMVSFAAGLSHEGYVPYVFSMAPFLSMRACEQCRTDVAYGNRNVRLMATYAGVSGGISGATHWSVEDCAIMTAIPNMTVLELSDPVQAEQIMDLSAEYPGPMYIRTSVEPVQQIYAADAVFSVGGSAVARPGDDGAFLCAGVVVQYAVAAADAVRAETGKEIRVVDLYSLKPLDRQAVMDAAATGAILTAQDHNVIGGLGYAVAAVLAEEGLHPAFCMVGIPDRFDAMAHAPYLYKTYGYDPEGLKSGMLRLLEQKNR